MSFSRTLQCYGVISCPYYYYIRAALLMFVPRTLHTYNIFAVWFVVALPVLPSVLALARVLVFRSMAILHSHVAHSTSNTRRYEHYRSSCAW